MKMSESSRAWDKKPKVNNNQYASSNQSDSGVVSRIFQSILTFLQENNNGVFTIFTSNDISKMPPELTRTGRLDTQWFFDLPDADERAAIWKIHTGRYPIKFNKELTDIAVEASENFTGAEIEGAVNALMRSIFVQGKTSIMDTDIWAACHEITPVYFSSKEKIAALRTWVKDRARVTHKVKEDKITDTWDPLGL